MTAERAGTMWKILLGCAALGASAAGASVPIEYGGDRPEALAACDRALHRGRQAEAQGCFNALLMETADPRIKAEAARALGDVRGANGYFQQAEQQYPEDAQLKTRWGELFLQTHQDNEAVRLFQEALEIDGGLLPAKLGLAKVSVGRFEDRAKMWLDEVLEADPGNIQARLLQARMALEEGDVDDADRKLDEALELVERRDLPPLEVYALKASVDLLRGVTDSEWTRRALEYNPRYGEIYATPAHFYVITRRYREAIELLRKAVDVQPDLYSAHAELGVNLLRENRVDEAQRHLAVAYQGDPYSAQIVNTLRLIDSFDNFVVITRDRQGTDEPAPPPVLMRLHKDEAPVLEEYVFDLVSRSIDTFSERYGFEVQQPVVVELYPEHDDFAVRTSGLPGIGLLGVTFGYLVAMDSPSGRNASEFHWGTTLWHEMAHVFTLEATNHLVPRWFSEGVSVHEEWATGPLPGRHLALPFFEALKQDALLPVAELDRGFIRPSYPAQVIVSYMQAGLTCEYIAERWGQQALERMLDEFAAGADTPAAIRAALGIEPEAFDEAFEERVNTLFGSIAENLEPWQEAQGRAHEAAREERWGEALRAADEAIALFPDYVDEGSAYLIKARAHLELEQREQATAALAEYRRRGGHDPEALMRLADALRADDHAEAVAVLEDLLLVAPLEQTLHAKLGDWLLEDGDAEGAAREYRTLLAMDPHDKAAAHFRLARAYHAMEDLERTREHLLYALEIAPHYREAQQLLLEIVR
ncbi:MAG TPA: tetratricopeptide repeat protein [Gammaproteobacteria bacterium]